MVETRAAKSLTDKIYGFFLIPLLVYAFYVIDHNWTASEYIAYVTFSYDGTENITADRLESVNYGSTSFRMILAAVGLLGLILPSTRKPNLKSPILYAWLAFWGWLFLSVAWSVNTPQTIFKLCVLGVFALSFIGITRRQTFEDWNFTLATTCCCFILLGIVAELQLRTFIPLTSGYRFTGTTHPNTQAVYGTFAVLVGSLYFGKSWRWTWWSLAFITIGFSAVVLTKSRTSLAGMIIGVSAIQALKARGAKRILLFVGGLGIVSVGLLVISLLGSKSQGSVGKIAAMGRTEDVTSLTGRVPLWEELMTHIGKRPLLGHGYLGFWDADRVEYLGDTFKWEIPHGHNIYIDMMIDGGIICLALFLTFLGVLAWNSARLFTRDEIYSAAIPFGIVFVVALHGIGESLFKLPTFCGFILYSLVARSIWANDQDADIPPDDDQVEETMGSNYSTDLVGV